MLITDDAKSLEMVLKNINVKVILHKMLIDFEAKDEIDTPWDVDDEDLSDLDYATCIQIEMY